MSPPAGNPTPVCVYCAGSCDEPLVGPVEDRLKVVPGSWVFWRCRQCGSTVLVPPPRTADLPGCYPPVYGFTPDGPQPSHLKSLITWVEYHMFFKPQYAGQVRVIARRTAGCRNPAPRLLDIGCGRGLRLLAFRQQGYHVHGVDFQPEVVEDLQRRLGIPAVCADATEFAHQFPHDSFELITAFHVLEHVPDVRATLQNCFSLLRPGGWLVSAVPLMDCLQASVLGSRWVVATEAPRHLSIPSIEGITRLHDEVGFDPVEIRPDSLLNCIGTVVLSWFPGAATTHMERLNPFQALRTSILALLIGLFAAPWCLVENYLLRRPSIGMVFARKPLAAGEAR